VNDIPLAFLSWYYLNLRQGEEELCLLADSRNSPPEPGISKLSMFKGVHRLGTHHPLLILEPFSLFSPLHCLIIGTIAGLGWVGLEIHHRASSKFSFRLFHVRY
jgi:hypothetical protein